MFARALLVSALPAVAMAGGDNYFNGDGTSYTLGQTSSGNCNFMYDPGVGDYYAALNNDQWDDTLNCGRCAEVSCDDSRCSDTSKTATVWIVDRCPECVEGDLDLSPTVFKELTGSDPSRYSIKWKFVDCPVSGGIQYCAKSGSSSSWLAVQPANMARGVASMKIANQDVTMVDSCYYFLLDGGSNVDMSAVNIELTSVSGETLTETVALSADNCTQGWSNFVGGGWSQSTGQTSQMTPTTPTPLTWTPGTIAPTPTSPTVQTPTAPTPTWPTWPPATTAPTAPTWPPATTAPTATTATPSKGGWTFKTKQSKVSATFSSLNGTSKDSLPGKVEPADETSSGVSILQSKEAGVEKTPSTNTDDDSDETAGSPKQATTKSGSTDASTSPVIIALVVCAVVGAFALGVVAFMAKRKKLDEKRIDRDEAMARSFDTFSSPVRIQSTIAQI